MDTEKYGGEYPRELPDATELFLLPDVVDGAIGLLKGIRQPALAYIHFYPPHEPYHPTKEFFGTFADGWKPPDKPFHDLSDKKYEQSRLTLEHQYYDEFLASWDQEVSRLFRYLEESGLAQNSHIIVTSDHGELFERGELGHWTPLLYDPVVHVPLIISSPGQTARQDIHTFTSSVDILPTIAHLSGNPVPDWAEGRLLPTLGGQEDPERAVFSLSDLRGLLQLILQGLGRVVNGVDALVDLIHVFAKIPNRLILGQCVSCPALLLIGLEGNPFLTDALIGQSLYLTNLGHSALKSLVQPIVRFLSLLRSAHSCLECRNLTFYIAGLDFECLEPFLPILPGSIPLHLLDACCCRNAAWRSWRAASVSSSSWMRFSMLRMLSLCSVLFSRASSARFRTDAISACRSARRLESCLRASSMLRC